MLMARDEFAAKEIVDPRTGVEVLISLSALSRGVLVGICERPVLSSGQRYRDSLATTDSWLAGD